MRAARLEYLRRYRATVTIDPRAKCCITADMVACELARWQLYGDVVDTPTGYRLEAEFRGRSGTYSLPDEVESLEIVG